MDIEYLMNSSEYKTMKTIYEKEYFKLFGKYCKISQRVGIQEKTASEMSEKFKNKKVKVMMIEESSNKKGVTISTKKQISRSFFDVWSNDSTIPEYDDIVFECDKNKVEKTDYNLFDGFKHFDNLKPIDIDIEPFFEHVRTLTNYVPNSTEYLLDFLAHMFQRPEVLPDVALIFISKEGIGKDLFAELLQYCLGDKYFGTTDKLEQVCGKFNSILGGKLLMVLNETNPIESSQRQENIKAMITAKKLYIEEKYKTPVKCSSFVRFIFFSNREFAFPVEEGSRRPNIMKCSDKYLPENYGKEKSAKYFTKLAQKFQDKDFQYAVLRFLLNRDISKFNPRVFEKSELHKTLEDISINPLFNFMAERIVKSSIERKITMFKRCSSLFLKEYNDYLSSIGYKFDMTPKKFIAEMKSLFNATVKKSSVTYIIVDIEYTKKLLTDKYNFNFNVDENAYSKSKDIDIEDDKNKDNKPKNDNEDINEKYKNKLSKKDEEIEKLKKIIEDLQKPMKAEVIQDKQKKEKKQKYLDPIEERMMKMIEEMDDEETDDDEIDEIEEPIKPKKNNIKFENKNKNKKNKNTGDKGLLTIEQLEKQKVNMKDAKKCNNIFNLFDDL